MSTEFEDIKIVSMDDAASSRTDPNLALVNIVLNLSSSASQEWASYFNQLWQQHIYMMKRKASVSGNRLEIYCAPDELQKKHIPELNKIMDETNIAYKTYLSNQAQQKTAKDAQDAAEREYLKSIKIT